VGKYYELRHIEHNKRSKWHLGAGLPGSPIISRKNKVKRRKSERGRSAGQNKKAMETRHDNWRNGLLVGHDLIIIPVEM
jgi:hypothetical protein